MTGMNINFGLSVFKREAKPASEVEKKLSRDGWNKTGSVANGRVQYFEKSGINITTVSGPRGTVILPSGPIRGRLFGQGVGINMSSVIGAGSKSDNQNKQSQKSNRTNSTRSLI